MSVGGTAVACRVGVDRRRRLRGRRLVRPVVVVFVVVVLVLCVEVVEVSVVAVEPGEGSLPPGSGLPCFANASARPISSFAFE